MSVTDSLGCINVENVNILDGIEWVISFDSTDANCNMNDGAAMITQVTNSTAPLSYIWSDGQTTDTAFNLYARIDKIPEPVPISICLLYTSPSPRDQRGSGVGGWEG